jgi:hypothetical protein
VKHGIKEKNQTYKVEVENQHERTPPNLFQSNGVVKRKNRILTDLVNSMLDTTGLSKAW